MWKKWAAEETKLGGDICVRKRVSVCVRVRARVCVKRLIFCVRKRWGKDTGRWLLCALHVVLSCVCSCALRHNFCLSQLWHDARVSFSVIMDLLLFSSYKCVRLTKGVTFFFVIDNVNPFRHMFMNIFDVSKCAFMTIKSAFNERDDSRASGRQIDFLLAF